jgi:glycosidase
MYFLKGTPFIYQGQEIGMTNYDVETIYDFVDIESKNVIETMKKLHLPKKYIDKSIRNGSRDNSRVPMHWDNSMYAGFSNVTPWLGVNKNKDSVNVSASLADPNSILNYYKKLIKVYKEETSIVRDGVYKDLLPRSSKIFAYERVLGDEVLLVISNFSKKEVAHKLFEKYIGYDFEVLLNNYEELSGTLKPYQSVLIKLKK